MHVRIIIHYVKNPLIKYYSLCIRTQWCYTTIYLKLLTEIRLTCFSFTCFNTIVCRILTCMIHFHGLYSWPDSSFRGKFCRRCFNTTQLTESQLKQQWSTPTLIPWTSHNSSAFFFSTKRDTIHRESELLKSDWMGRIMFTWSGFGNISNCHSVWPYFRYWFVLWSSKHVIKVFFGTCSVHWP